MACISSSASTHEASPRPSVAASSHFLSALAEDERQQIVKRANDGRAAARKRGLHVGRKPKLTELHNVASLASALPRARGSEPFGNYAGSAIDVVAEFGVLVQLPAATA
jgi:hypothetical protein